MPANDNEIPYPFEWWVERQPWTTRAKDAALRLHIRRQAAGDSAWTTGQWRAWARAHNGILKDEG